MPHQWSWTLLRAGAFRLDGGSMFGVVPKVLWSKLTAPDERNRIDLQTNCLLLDDGSTRVLIEAGYGDKWSDKERDIFHLEPRTVADALREANVDPATIDHVVVSHLHFDHAGGLTRAGADGPVPEFPRATVHVQRREWDDALANRSTMTRTYLRSHLDPVADRVRCVDGGAEILPGIHVEPMPGHTWGQQAIRFDDGDGIVVFPGDVCPTVHHAGAAFSLAYDMEPYTNMRSKADLFAAAIEEGRRLVLDHEPGDSVVVRVERDRDRPDRTTLVPA